MAERIKAIQQFLKDSPDDCFLNHALALELIKTGREEEAKLVFEKNLAFDPTYIPSYYHLGKLLERLGQTEAAIPLYKNGMEQARKAGDMHTYNELQAAYEDLVY
jgi:tetratricopeptide (TPR) repeat protein